MKSNTEHPVPLSVQVVEPMDRARALDRGSELIFMCRAGGGARFRPVTSHDFAKVLRPLGYRDETGKRPIVMHGFRATFRGWAMYVAQAHCEVAELALSHLGEAAVRSCFRREGEVEIEVRRALMQASADYVLPRTDVR